MSRTYGVILSVPVEVFQRLSESGRDVLVKYMRGTPRLHSGMPMLFYSSRPVSKVIGEALIDSFEFLRPQEALIKYGSRMVLSQYELQEYMRPQGGVFKRGDKEALILVVSTPRKYRFHVSLKGPMVPSLKYIDRKELLSIRKLSGMLGH